MILGIIPWYEVPVAFVMTGIAAGGAFVLKKVTAGGAVAGLTVGIALFLFAGPAAFVILMAFFISSVFAGRAGGERKRALEQIWEKGGRRDQWQALANTGPQAAMAVAALVAGSSARADPAVFVGIAGGFAAATADTWASELGSVFGGRPVSLRSLRPTRPGESGAISAAGTVLGLGGALLIGVLGLLSVWAIVRASVVPALEAGLVIFAAGAVGFFLDSLLGAFVQVQFVAESGALVEKRKPGARRARGLPFVGNDVVNLISTTVATLGAWAVAELSWAAPAM